MTKMLRSAAALAGLAIILMLGIHTPASAQQMSPCGYWSEGVWVATPCVQPVYPEPPQQVPPVQPNPAAVSGTIVGINANMLTVEVGPAQNVVINDEPALHRMDTGRIYTGRVIVAYGYWTGGEFIATSIS